MVTLLKPLRMLNRKASPDDTPSSPTTKLPALPKAPSPVTKTKVKANAVSSDVTDDWPTDTIDDHNLTKLSFATHSGPDYTYNPKEKMSDEISPHFTYNGESFKLEGEQPALMKKIFEWLFTNPSHRKPFMRLAGYAGTGKTSCIAYLINEGQNFFPSYMQKLSPVICTFTWKAALVLQSRGVPAVSIHSIFYKPVKVGDKTVFERRDPHEIRTSYSMIIIDEASMVDFKMRQDIETIGLPVLYVGDSGQ